jgi:hypothetical protein
LFGDHGYHLGDHNQWGKHTQFENSARAPLIISAPNGTSGQHDAPVEFIDIYPTLCDLAGVAIPSSRLQGESLAPVLRGETISKNLAVTEYRAGGGSSYSFRSERYRLTLWMQSSNDRPDLMQWDASRIKAVELYDYETDPLETTNLANATAYTSIVSDLKTQAASWWNQQNSFFNGQSTGELTIPFIEHFENYQINEAFNGDFWLHNASLWEQLWKGDYLQSFTAKVVDESTYGGSQALELTFTPKASADNGELIKLRTIDLQSFEGEHFIVSYRARANMGSVRMGAASQAADWNALTTEYQYFFDTVSLNNNRLFLYFNNMELTAGQEYKVWIDDLKISYTSATEVNDINDKELIKLTIYPNPATDQLFFETTGYVSKAKVFDTRGKLLLSQENPGDAITVSSLSKGIYFVEVNTGETSSIHKFIKK